MPAYTYDIMGAGSDTTTYEGIRYFSDTALKLQGTFVSRDGNLTTADYTNMVGSADQPLSLHSRIQHTKNADGEEISRYTVRLNAFVDVTDTGTNEVTSKEIEVIIGFNIPPVLRNTALVQDAIQILYTALQNQSVQGTASSATDRAVTGLSALVFGIPSCFGA